MNILSIFELILKKIKKLDKDCQGNTNCLGSQEDSTCPPSFPLLPKSQISSKTRIPWMNNPPTAQSKTSYGTKVNLTSKWCQIFSWRELLTYGNSHRWSCFRLCVVLGKWDRPITLNNFLLKDYSKILLLSQYYDILMLKWLYGVF